jgi:hypothetical protein
MRIGVLLSLGASATSGGGVPTAIAIVPSAGDTAGSTHVVIHVDDSTGATSAAIDG